jgi:FAD binding domain
MACGRADARVGANPEVLVVGAGPTGAVSAILLRSLGVCTLVVERNPATNDKSRAVTSTTSHSAPCSGPASWTPSTRPSSRHGDESQVGQVDGVIDRDSLARRTPPLSPADRRPGARVYSAETSRRRPASRWTVGIEIATPQLLMRRAGSRNRRPTFRSPGGVRDPRAADSTRTAGPGVPSSRSPSRTGRRATCPATSIRPSRTERVGDRTPGARSASVAARSPSVTTARRIVSRPMWSSSTSCRPTPSPGANEGCRRLAPPVFARNRRAG